MPHTSGPQLRVHATIVVLLYACILVGGALLQHAPLCPNTAGPHCTICACVSAASLIIDLPQLAPDSAVGVSVVASVQSGARAPSRSEIGSRAPPAAGAAALHSTADLSTSGGL